MKSKKPPCAFLYLKCGKKEKAAALASTLPHMRERREVIQPLISKGLTDDEINESIKNILLGCNTKKSEEKYLYRG